nr:MAG TPA: hypothetical protein [Caudoviricetes sp.]
MSLEGRFDFLFINKSIKQIEEEQKKLENKQKR